VEGGHVGELEEREVGVQVGLMMMSFGGVRYIAGGRRGERGSEVSKTFERHREEAACSSGERVASLIIMWELNGCVMEAGRYMIFWVAHWGERWTSAQATVKHQRANR
jgi:hypothetical protein